MEWENHSLTEEFFLKGLSGYPRLEHLFFVLILMMYAVILVGNGTLIIISIFDSNLHTPMYFFLGNLSFLDICFTTSSIPFALVSFLSERKTISFLGCAVQMFLGLAMGTTECVLLGMMAFDRYVAICNPLRYPIIMSKSSYVTMATGSWFSGVANSAVQTTFVMRLPFCGNVINHFLCEILAVMKMACTDISGNEFIMVVATILFTLMPLLLIVFSYSLIISSILKIHSAEGRSKAFSTCSSHFTVVIIFYGTILFMYMKPKSKDTFNVDDLDATDKLISMFYGVMTPLMNPLIYSLRNKDVKEAIKNLKRRFVGK
ncbi:olfactory receptor 13C9 [Cricetulus griseus]|uniref:Olfactory receptor n=2 Tax=Cricetulus griseus TaxID=10029 RepID=A0A3L7I5M4_CRIGR|nr:olfactory receptor 13C9 [Cricetulus griseus]XP_027259403.1 olfactory receptor 13C9 [Cricetulus griseus]ERE82442.1 olfactory receptor 13C9-like protein [Cricetulus griseus]